MNSVGIDVSKGKSMVAVTRPLDDIIIKPTVVSHDSSELSALVEQLKAWKVRPALLSKQPAIIIFP